MRTSRRLDAKRKEQEEFAAAFTRGGADLRGRTSEAEAEAALKRRRCSKHGPQLLVLSPPSRQMR